MKINKKRKKCLIPCSIHGATRHTRYQSYRQHKRYDGDEE